MARNNPVQLDLFEEVEYILKSKPVSNKVIPCHTCMYKKCKYCHYWCTEYSAYQKEE